MKLKTLRPIGHINTLDIYLRAKEAPKGVKFKKELHTGEDSFDPQAKAVLHNAALSLIKISKLSLEKKLYNIHLKLQKKYKVIC